MGIDYSADKRAMPVGWLRVNARSIALLASDLLAMWLAWALALIVALFYERAELALINPLSAYAGQLYVLVSAGLLVAFAMMSQYTRRTSFWEETRAAWRLLVFGALANFALNFFAQVSFNRTVVLLAWVCAFFTLPLVRLTVREALIPLGLWQRRTLILGNEPTVDDVAKAIARERHMGLSVVERVGLSPDADAVSSAREAEALARERACDSIVVVLDDQNSDLAARVVRRLHSQQFEVFVVPSLQGLPVQGMEAQYFFSHDVLFLRVRHRLFNRPSRWLKRGFDVVAASALLVALSPLLALVAWRIWREDGGAVLYSQPRIGIHGRDFEFFKFRSMVKNADAELERWKTEQPELYQAYVDSNFKLANDPRVLKVGGWIRRRSIDELPQLWNVLRGDMALIGPRPLLRRELPDYADDVFELYKQVRPGITGLWQVSGRSQTSFVERANYDSWYVRNWSIWVDWVILLKTVRVVLSAKGAV
jgi:Undecaprenyl-phosphate galactose phosphotransferase WbaP